MLQNHITYLLLYFIVFKADKFLEAVVTLLRGFLHVWSKKVELNWAKQKYCGRFHNIIGETMKRLQEFVKQRL
jgi:hypothetical protein